MVIREADPRLVSALGAGRRSGRPVQAVVTLRSAPNGRPLTPEATEDSVRQIVQEATDRAVGSAKRVKVFRHLQSFAIEADADVVQEVLENEQVEAASLNSAY